jgi:hypothetical protein
MERVREVTTSLPLVFCMSTMYHFGAKCTSGYDVEEHFSGTLVHAEQKNQRACEIELLACCTWTVGQIY